MKTPVPVQITALSTGGLSLVAVGFGVLMLVYRPAGSVAAGWGPVKLAVAVVGVLVVGGLLWLSAQGLLRMRKWGALLALAAASALSFRHVYSNIGNCGATDMRFLDASMTLLPLLVAGAVLPHWSSMTWRPLLLFGELFGDPRNA